MSFYVSCSYFLLQSHSFLLRINNFHLDVPVSMYTVMEGLSKMRLCIDTLGMWEDSVDVDLHGIRTKSQRVDQMNKYVNLTKWDFRRKRKAIDIYKRSIYIGQRRCLLFRQNSVFCVRSVLPSLIDRLGDAKDQVRDQDQALLLKIMDQAANPQVTTSTCIHSSLSALCAILVQVLPEEIKERKFQKMIECQFILIIPVIPFFVI